MQANPDINTNHEDGYNGHCDSRFSHSCFYFLINYERREMTLKGCRFSFVFSRIFACFVVHNPLVAAEGCTVFFVVSHFLEASAEAWEVILGLICRLVTLSCLAAHTIPAIVPTAASETGRA